MLAKSITISSKGQITLPRDIVKHLGNKILKLEVLNGNEVKIVPVKDVAGKLSEYAKNIRAQDFNAIRADAWEEEVERKFTQENQDD